MRFKEFLLEDVPTKLVTKKGVTSRKDITTKQIKNAEKAIKDFSMHSKAKQIDEVGIELFDALEDIEVYKKAIKKIEVNIVEPAKDIFRGFAVELFTAEERAVTSVMKTANLLVEVSAKTTRKSFDQDLFIKNLEEKLSTDLEMIKTIKDLMAKSYKESTIASTVNPSLTKESYITEGIFDKLKGYISKAFGKLKSLFSKSDMLQKKLESMVR
jgi:hypothetical protein